MVSNSFMFYILCSLKFIKFQFRPVEFLCHGILDLIRENNRRIEDSLINSIYLLGISPDSKAGSLYTPKSSGSSFIGTDIYTLLVQSFISTYWVVLILIRFQNTYTHITN